jgi:hypothetical protein
MANTVFPMFQSQFLFDFSSASRSSETLGFAKHWDFQSKDVASGLSLIILSVSFHEPPSPKKRQNIVFRYSCRWEIGGRFRLYMKRRKYLVFFYQSNLKTGTKPFWDRQTKMEHYVLRNTTSFWFQICGPWQVLVMLPVYYEYVP